ncbi:MAG: hypothetical protein KL863_05445 [Rhizobium sp.]|nr:hypothetical protein [Rhizobium sp.]MBX9455503.1 hypothetical protein [Rhizobium sp.]
MNHTDTLPGWAAGTVSLASARLGAEGLFSTDAFFAPLSRMLSDEPPRWDPDLYDDNGKWMDGWESRRKRVAGWSRVGPVTHIRYAMHPDGGTMRLRLCGVKG